MARSKKTRLSFFGSIGFLSLMRSLVQSFTEFVCFAKHKAIRAQKQKEEQDGFGPESLFEKLHSIKSEFQQTQINLFFGGIRS